MTIKQQGGIFGRNPTFNNVTIDGELIINGDTFTGLDYQGAWNADTNTPTLASSVGTLGEFYIVSVAGATNLNGITNWGVGDWTLFNGSVWQRVEGGADGNFNDLAANSLTVNGNGVIDGDLTLQSDKDLLFLATNPNTGSPFQYGEIRFGDSFAGQYVNHAFIKSSGTYASVSTLEFHTSNSDSSPLRMKIAEDGNVSIVTGNLVIGTSGSGIDFSATSGTGTSELFNDYEEGTWTPIVTSGTGSITSYTSSGKYTKVGRIVTVEITYIITNNGTGASYGDIAGLPYTASVGCVGVTRFNGTTGLSGQYSVAAGNTSGTVWNYDNTYPWATNAAGTITITYSV